MIFWRDYFKIHGKPMSIYLDRHSTYKVNDKNALDDDAMITQFERAMKEVDIRVIHANSPQAKGRIENLFGTLQDRLVKELRLANINDVKEANIFLQDKFLPAFNTRFSVTPRSDIDIHRPITTRDNLIAVLSIQSKRYINRDFTIRFKNNWLQLTKVQPTLVLSSDQVLIEERLDNNLYLRFKGKYLNYILLKEKPTITHKLPIALATDLSLSKHRVPTIPSASHPWRKFTLLPYNITNKSNQKLPSKKIT